MISLTVSIINQASDLRKSIVISLPPSTIQASNHGSTHTKRLAVPPLTQVGITLSKSESESLHILHRSDNTVKLLS